MPIGVFHSEVAQSVVDRCLGPAFLAPPTHHRQGGIATQRRRSLIQPARHDFAVAIHELHEFDRRVQLAQPGQSRVARPRRRKGELAVELHDLRAQTRRQGDATVAGSGIDVDHGRRLPGKRQQTTAQALAFVAPDDDHANTRLGGWLLALLFWHRGSRRQWPEGYHFRVVCYSWTVGVWPRQEGSNAAGAEVAPWLPRHIAFREPCATMSSRHVRNCRRRRRHG